MKGDSLALHPDSALGDEPCGRRRQTPLARACSLVPVAGGLGPQISQVTFNPLFKSVSCTSARVAPTSPHESEPSGGHTEPGRDREVEQGVGVKEINHSSWLISVLSSPSALFSLIPIVWPEPSGHIVSG